MKKLACLFPGIIVLHIRYYFCWKSPKRGIFARFDLNGQDSFYADKANTFKNDSYAIMNAKIGYEGENFEVYCYGKNLADKEYNLEGYGGAFTMLSPPREFGVQLAYRF